MPTRTAAFGIVAILATMAAMPVPAQTAPAPPDPGLMAARQAAAMMKPWLTTAVEQMSEADYAFKPTPEVRSFGQLLAHVADLNYLFCSAAMGAQPPVGDIEKNRTTKADIQRFRGKFNLIPMGGTRCPSAR